MAKAEKYDPYASSLPGVLGVIDNLIARIEAIMLAIGVLLMAGNTMANVIGRFVFQSSLFFSEELNRILIILITFAGISYAARQGRHIRMSAVYDQMSEGIKKALMIIMCGGTAAVMFVLAYYSMNYLGGLIDRGTVTPALRVPLYVTYIWVPVGFIITGVQYTLAIVRNLREKDVYISYSEVDAYDEGDPAKGGGV